MSIIVNNKPTIDNVTKVTLAVASAHYVNRITILRNTDKNV